MMEDALLPLVLQRLNSRPGIDCGDVAAMSAYLQSFGRLMVLYIV